MAKLEKVHTFDGTVEQVFAAIRQYSKYGDYLPGVTRTVVLPAAQSGSSCQVRYELNLIKTFYYVLHMFEKSPTSISWTLADSNLMKENDGSWSFSDLGDGKTKAIYTLDIKFKGLVPSVITDQVAKANLPMMFSGFQRLIDSSKSA